MSENKTWHLAVFACCLGIVLYVATALWSALFIVDLPHDGDAVLDTVPIEREAGRYDQQAYTEHVPTKFKSTLEELKYQYNVGMLARNRYWFYATLIFGAIAGYVAFCLLPRWRRSPELRGDAPSTAAGAAFFGAFVALVVPMVLGWLLPAPAEWFPQKIRVIADLRQTEALSQLQQLAEAQDLYEQP